jgi:C-terminal processing protease CtpA/Prc
VKITPDDKIVLAKDYMSGEEKLFAGQVIQQINGVSAIQLLNEMQRYVGGESLRLRKQVVARRFPILLWAVYGFINDFDLKVSDTRFKLHTNKDWQSDKPALADHYYKKLNKDTGFLYLSHFDVSPEKFEKFVDKTFVEIKNDKVTNLIVDIRYNPGGNTDTVSYLSSYLSNKTFRVASSVKERLNEDNRGVFNYKGDVGEIIQQSWDETVQPIDSKNRFDGDVYVLVGSVSYSAAIVFATTLQDNNIATLVGEVTGGYANQSAQGNLFNLPNSQLRAYITTRLIVRPNGNESLGHVVPDYIVEETQASIKNGQDVMIEKVLNLIKSGD